MHACPVSAIIPTYNRAGLLHRALISVLKQDCPCQEIIVVDDGSTDETQGVVAELQEKSDTEIRYFQQENKGVAAARNVGIRKSRGRLLAFLDSDDEWHRKKIGIQYDQMMRQQNYLVSHTLEKWLRRGKHLNQKQKHIPRHGDIFQHCLELCAVGMSTVMVRRELFDLVGLFDESYPCCEDYELWLRVSSREMFLLVKEPLTIKHGGREDQLSRQYQVGMDRFRIDALEKLLGSASLAEGQQRALHKELVKKLTIYGSGCIRHGREEYGRQCIGRAEELLQKTGL